MNKRKLLTMMGGSIKYLLRDLFTSPYSAGSVNNTMASDGVSLRTVTDTTNKISQDGGKLVVAGGVGWGDTTLVYPGIARIPGRFLQWKQNLKSSTQGGYFGWFKDSGGVDPTSGTYRAGNGGASLSVYDGANLGVVGYIDYNEEIDLAIVLRSTGSFFLTKGGNFSSLAWTLLYALENENTATMYPAFKNYDAVCDIDEVIIRDKNYEKWLTDYGIATGHIATVEAEDEITSTTAALVEFTWTPGADEVLELDICRLDADNRYIIRCAQATSTLKTIQREVGTETELASTAKTWTIGTPYLIRVIKDLGIIDVLVDSANIHTVYPVFETGSKIVRVNLAGAHLTSYPRNLDKYGNEVLIPNANWAYATNAAAPLTTPTYDESGEAIHPDVYYNADGWNGKKYWMAFTVCTAGAIETENPSILCSDDGQTWTVPVGLTNPVIAYPGGTYWNADTDLIVDGNGVMWMIYKLEGGVLEGIYETHSSDGVTWSTPTRILTWIDPLVIVSPSIVWDGAQYLMFSVRATSSVDPNSYVERRTASAITGTWSDPVTVSMTLPSSVAPWHPDMIVDGARIYTVVSSNFNNAITFGYSDDWGLTWSMAGRGVLVKKAASWDSYQIYRSSIVRTATGFDLWYSGDNGTAYHIGFTKIVWPF